MGSVNILTMAPPSMAAPAGVWFEAVDVAGFNVASGPAPGETYDPSFHEITYVWTVRGKPLPPFDAPGNMVTGWNDPNIAYGKKVALLFPDPGTYTVDLWAIDSLGTTATAEVTLTVVDADSVYPGTRTICFSTGGSWAGEKPGCQRITTVAALQSALDSAGTPPRVLFRRGQDVPDIDLFIDDGRLGYMGAWGSGDRPILRPVYNQNILRIWNSYTGNELTITDIDFRGGWKSDTETGLPDESPLNFITNPSDCQFTVANCTFDGFTAVWLGTGSNHPARLIFANNVVTNWRDYGLFVHNTFDDGVRFAIIGCQVAQKETALNGGLKNGFFNTHGPIRCADAANFYIAITDLFSRTGWSGLNPDRADQPCLRYNHLASIGRSFNMDRCVCEGGFHPLAFAGQNSGTVENPGNLLIDKALLIATAKSSKAFVVTEYGGLTIRNTLCIMPNVPAYHGINWVGAIRYEIDNPTTVNTTAPMALYSSTFLSLRDASNDPDHLWAAETGASAFAMVTVENNVLHGPGLNAAITADQPVSTAETIPGVQPRYRGVLYNFDHESGTLNSSVASGDSFTLPYPAGTDQAYWLANAATDTAHVIGGVGGYYYAVRGEMSVAYQANNIEVTNSSGTTWASGSNWDLKLDRTSRLPGFDSAYASPTSLPLPVVQAGSRAYEGAVLGLRAHDDFFGTVRPIAQPGGPNPSAGAIEP